MGVMQPEKLVVFIDDKNIYKGARHAFFDDSYPHYYGQINPAELAKLICSRPPAGVTRLVRQVRMYSGSPDSSKEPKAYAAHTKQCAAWRKLGVEVITRTLKYLDDWPKSKAEQKGMDCTPVVRQVGLGESGGVAQYFVPW